MENFINDGRDNDPTDWEFTFTYYFDPIKDYDFHYINDDPSFCNSEPKKKSFLYDIEDLSSVTKNYFENTFE